MSTSSNPKIQQLMDEMESLTGDDIEAKLQQIAEAVAAEQQKLRPRPAADLDGPIDPADAFACDGCQ
ncbi:MAG TPA: hypothetical protein VLI54_00020 [Bacillota bacterium]|nr:hypothetical protein [Bacillota bacterium]